MPDTTPPCTLTLDTHDLAAMTAFYTQRLGFEHVETVGAGVMFERNRLRHPLTGVEVVFRNCLPRPHIGSTIGSLMRIDLPVADPDAASAGLDIDERAPEEGPADRIVVRDPSNYTLALVRAGGS
ncbi:MAG: VOC family protein [Planctomycetota bacterium]